MQAGTTTLVTVDPAGTSGAVSTGSQSSAVQGIDFGGNKILFASTANNLVAGGSGTTWDLFPRDMATGTTSLVTRSPFSGVEANANTIDGQLSDDGNWIALTSSASDLVSGVAADQAYLYDVTLQQFAHVSVDSSGNPCNGTCFGVCVSGKGGLVAFNTSATNLDPKDVSTDPSIYVRDVGAGTTEYISWSEHSQAATTIYEWAASPVISPNGRWITWTSIADSYVPYDVNASMDVFLKDRFSNADDVELVSQTTTCGAANPGNFIVMRVLDTGEVTFFSDVTNLVAPPTTPNLNQWSAYVNIRGSTYSTFCIGFAANCPCANPGTGCTGCLRGNGVAAAHSAFGTASLSADTVTLAASNAGTGLVIFDQSFAKEFAGFGSANGDGVLCLGSPQRRLATRSGIGGTALLGAAVPDPFTVSQFGAITLPGTAYYQCWVRDANPTFCSAATYNWTNGIRIVWAP